MRSIFAVLSLLVAVVAAAPLVFDDHLLKHGDVEGRLTALHHVSYHLSEEDKPVGHVYGASHPVLRLVYLVPALHKVHDLSVDGFASKLFGVGHEPKHHAFTKLPAHELLVDLLALSDCRKWYGVLLKVWDHGAGLVTHRAWGGLWSDDRKFKLVPLDMDGLLDFVRTHAGVLLLPGLLKKGVVAHVFTHKLHALVKHLL